MPEGIGYKMPTRQYPNKGGTKAPLSPLLEPSPPQHRAMRGHKDYTKSHAVKQYPGVGGKR